MCWDVQYVGVRVADRVELWHAEMENSPYKRRNERFGARCATWGGEELIIIIIIIIIIVIIIIIIIITIIIAALSFLPLCCHYYITAVQNSFQEECSPAEHANLQKFSSRF